VSAVTARRRIIGARRVCLALGLVTNVMVAWWFAMFAMQCRSYTGSAVIRMLIASRTGHRGSRCWIRQLRLLSRCCSVRKRPT
jgi:hypothetical protein